MLEAGIASARRAATLTQRLLAFSRKQSLDLRRVDVRELVLSMRELIVQTLGEASRLELALADDAWPAHGDANQIENALLNFVINARDAMPDGGTLTVEVRNVARGAPELAACGLDPADYVVLRVHDTGLGMAPDVLDRVFDPFFTTKPVGQGTGLGLSMAYGYAKQAKGDIAVESLPGRGTTISLYMRRRLAAREPAAAAD